MKFGIHTLPLRTPDTDRTKSYHDDALNFIWADELGFSEAWMGEHYTIPWEPVPAADLFIAFVAARTKDIRLGTGIHLLTMSDPRLVAMRIAYLDHLTEGRFNFGVGAGGNAFDFKWFDVEPGSQQRKATEALDIILRLWTERGAFEYEGEFWNFNVPEALPDKRYHIYPRQQPYPPIMMSGLSVKSPSIKMAGERGHWPSSVQFHGPSALATQWQIYEDAALAAGHVPDRRDWRIAREIFVARTDAEAQDLVRESALHDGWKYWIDSLRMQNQLGLVKVDPEMPDDAVDYDYLVDNIWIVGSPDTVTERLTTLYKEVGGWGTTLQIQYEWSDPAVWRRNMELLMTEVYPNVEGLEPEGAG